MMSYLTRWLLATVVLVAACAESGPYPQPDDYGLECDPSLADTCSSGMDCVPLGGHNDPYHSVPDELYACAVPCNVQADCPENTCARDLSPTGGGDPYPCAEDGYCIVAWCTSNGPYR